MAVQGNAQELREDVSFKNKYFYGFAQVNQIVAVNPTAKERAKIFGYEYDEDKHKDYEYLQTNDEGEQSLQVWIYMKLHNDEIIPYVITLKNQLIEYKDESAGTVKYKWVNQLGQTFVCFDESELPEWFTHFNKWNDTIKKYEKTEETKSYKKALVGEDKLITFVRECLSKLAQNSNASIFQDVRKMFKTGNCKEVYSDLTSEFFSPFVVLLHVQTSEDGTKFYQKFYIGSNTFNVPSLPGLSKGNDITDTLKYVRNGCNFPSYRQKLWNKWKEGAEDAKYGATGFFKLVEIKEYNPEEDIASSNEVKKVEAADADY